MKITALNIVTGLINNKCIGSNKLIHNRSALKIVTGFGKIGLNAANNFFQYPRVKPYGSIFFEKIFMAEMDRHQLALAYDAVVSSGVL